MPGISGNSPCPITKQITYMPKKTKKVIITMADNRSKRGNGSKSPADIQAVKVGTLKDLRKATQHTQDDLAATMGVGQGTISRMEKQHDMLVSTLQHYVQSLGGTLQILATFPNRAPLLVESLGKKISKPSKDTNNKPADSKHPSGT